MLNKILIIFIIIDTSPETEFDRSERLSKQPISVFEKLRACYLKLLINRYQPDAAVDAGD